MKNILILITLLVFSNNAVSSPFEKTPYGIKPGITKNSELEKRGLCTSRVKVSSSYTRCASYDFSGKFSVFSSQSEVATKIYIDSIQSHRLPRNLRHIGLSFPKWEQQASEAWLAVKDGTEINDVVNIIKSQGITNIENIDDKLIFYVGGLEYVLRVPSHSGLSRVEITESY